MKITDFIRKNAFDLMIENLVVMALSESHRNWIHRGTLVETYSLAAIAFNL